MGHMTAVATRIAAGAALGAVAGGAAGLLQTEQADDGLTALELRGAGIATTAGMSAGAVFAYGFPAGPPYNGRAGWLVAAMGAAALGGGLAFSWAN